MSEHEFRDDYWGCSRCGAMTDVEPCDVPRVESLTDQVAREHAGWTLRMDVLVCRGCKEPLRAETGDTTTAKVFARHVAQVTEAAVRERWRRDV